MSLFKSIFGKGSSHDSNDAELILELQGTVAYESRDIKEAIKIFTNGIGKYPSNPYFYYMRGVSREEIKNWDEAIADYNRYLQMIPDHYNALFRIGLCYQNSQRFDLALKYYDLSEKHYQKFVTAIENLEIARKKKIKGSYYAIQKEKIFSNRAIVKSTLGDSVGAIADCGKAISINSKYPNPYFIRGVEFFKSNQLEKAKSDLLKASSLGYTIANQVLQQFPKENQKDVFFKQVKTFAESDQARQMFGGTRFRFGCEPDIRSNLDSYGIPIDTIPYDNLLQEAADYSSDMWNEFKKYKNIDELTKAFISYEVTLALKSIRPDINVDDFWINSYNLANRG